ncbi:MAG: PIN domain-containing protein [Actinobacteria bacterium]|nr:PIN domain-containing protein [Actinomycetota bacterium]
MSVTRNGTPIVLDTSALLAWLLGETGADVVREAIGPRAVVSAANWAELARKVSDKGIDWPQLRNALVALGLNVEPVTAADAETSATIGERGDGLSLGDRLCIAVGRRLNCNVLTADTAWTQLPGVVLIRRGAGRP